MENQGSCCAPKNADSPPDYLLWITGSILFIALLVSFLPSIPQELHLLSHFSGAVRMYLEKMVWGILLSLFFVGWLSRVPEAVVARVLGKPGSVGGIFRAVGAGFFFDLCNHGIILVGMKLFKKGASLGQTMAFLISSPWNSFSVTIVMVSLIGLGWTLTFVLGSLLVAVCTGIMVDKYILVQNTESNLALPAESSQPTISMKDMLATLKFGVVEIPGILKTGFFDSAMMLRWLFLGVIIAAAIHGYVSEDILKSYFGPTLLGLLATLVATTLIEVCSEGSAPVAAELIQRAAAPGNAFTFLMAGASTDYTEILAIKEATGSWRTSLILPLLTVPQILLISILLNSI